MTTFAPPSSHFNARPIVDRLLAKVRLGENDCWLWQGALRDGYGLIGYASGKCMNAHRAAYEIFIGPIPAGMQLDHLCRVRHCINPWHLEPVTQAENVRRGVSPAAVHAKQTHCKRGHPLNGANLYINPNGGRVCRACRTAARRAKERSK